MFDEDKLRNETYSCMKVGTDKTKLKLDYEARYMNNEDKPNRTQRRVVLGITRDELLVLVCATHVLLVLCLRQLIDTEFATLVGIASRCHCTGILSCQAAHGKRQIRTKQLTTRIN